MRILIVNTNWGNGGPGGVASDLYDVVKARGHEVCFAYGRGNVPPHVNAYRIGNKISNILHAFTTRLFDNSGFASTYATKRFVNYIKRYKPDIISFHNPLGYYINLRVFFKYIKTTDIPVFWTLHDCWTITGHCITGLCDNFFSGCGHCPRLKEYPKTILDRTRNNCKRKIKCLSGIDNVHIVTPSSWLADLVRLSFWKSNKLTVIPNGIDLNVFRYKDSDLRKKYNLDRKFIVLAVAGSWEPTKGSKYFYKLTSLLDEKYAFVMIGTNNDKDLLSNKRIIHIDRTTNRDELVCWYSTADVLANPTMGDNFPTVNLEALACGTPVVTFNTGGSGESVGSCGMVVPQEDVEEMAKSIKLLKDHPISGDICRKRALNYNKNQRYEEYLNLFLNDHK